MSFEKRDAPSPDVFSPEEREKAPKQPRISARRTAALELLRDSISAAREVGERVPCIEDPNGGWTSGDPKARARAATLCAGCAVLADCASYFARFEESGGVWGGRSNEGLHH